MFCRFIVSLVIFTNLFSNQVLGNNKLEELKHHPQLGLISLKDIKEKFVEKLKEFNETLNRAVAIALEKIQALFKTIKKLNDKAVEKAKNLFTKSSNDIEQKLDKLKNATLNKRSDCFKQQGNKIIQLPITYLIEAESCITMQAKEATKIVGSIANKVNSTCAEVDEIKLQMDICQDDFWCSAGVLADTTTKIVSLPLKISKEVFQTVTFVNNLPQKLGLCATSIVTKIAFTGGKILLNTTKCLGK